ncbi:MAG: DUF6090 family protein [Fulvivirga sp.]|uniref:DUF6090 family protein n=1 Tax=Fulvivirga sp. TaxID=1931237 RepID=UPI0032ECD5AA
MKNNKITTYLLYAIGEIILVVVGILIAVSIDDWNEGIKENEKQLKIYNDILIDLEKDQQHFNGLLEVFKEHNLNYYDIYDAIKIGKQVVNEKAYDWMLYNRTFAPVTKQNHQSSIDKLKNNTIRTSLNEYFTIQEGARIAINEFNDIIRSQTRPYFLSENLFNDEAIFQEDKYAFLPKGTITNKMLIAEALKQPKMLQALVFLRISTGYSIAALKRLVNANNDLILMLEKEIDKQ